MVNRWRLVLIKVIESITIQSQVNFSWFGRSMNNLPARTQQSLSHESAREYLFTTLATRLYLDFYRHGVAVSEGMKESASPIRMDRTPFIESLSASNTGIGFWSDGWGVHEIKDGTVVVCLNGLKVWVNSDFVLASESSSIDIGNMVQVKMPNESVTASPGFYMVFGNQPLDTQSSVVNTLRIYWNVTSDGAPDLIFYITEMLNKDGIPFQFKVLNNPSLYQRCDAGVLYISSNDYIKVSEIITIIYPKIVNSLKSGTPAFTKRLADGIALAEDPDNNKSFGMHRCELFAEGMIRAYENNISEPDKVLQLIADYFTEICFDLDQPFLNPDKRDIYSLPCLAKNYSQSKVQLSSSQEDFLLQALKIGRSIAQQALWHNNTCNWVGAAPERTLSNQNDQAVVYAALGSELYNGTSGISLFLAELSVETGDIELKRVAQGASRHALLRPAASLKQGLWGLYTGWPGIALASIKVANLTKSQELTDLSHKYIKQHITSAYNNAHVDLLSGLAGGVIGLLTLAQYLEENDKKDVEELAISLGDKILEVAIRSPKGTVSWSTISNVSHNLTGMAHGVAGIGSALALLYAHTKLSKFYKGASRAFAYERTWYNSQQMNWPDFRLEQGESRQAALTHKYSCYWCHGAAGIGLSRLSASDYLCNKEYKKEAINASLTTAESLKVSLERGLNDYSLCHGISGQADILMQMTYSTNQEIDDLIVEAANRGIKLYGKSISGWPCGCPGESPGLMLGLSGIGYWYLRLHNPSIQSPLNFEKILSKI